MPEDIKQRMLALHEENVSVKEQYKTAQEKLVKAKAVHICATISLRHPLTLVPVVHQATR